MAAMTMVEKAEAEVGAVVMVEVAQGVAVAVV